MQGHSCCTPDGEVLFWPSHHLLSVQFRDDVTGGSLHASLRVTLNACFATIPYIYYIHVLW